MQLKHRGIDMALQVYIYKNTSNPIKKIKSVNGLYKYLKTIFPNTDTKDLIFRRDYSDNYFKILLHDKPTGYSLQFV